MIIFKQGKLIINKYTFKLTSNYKKINISICYFYLETNVQSIIKLCFIQKEPFINLNYGLET